MSLIHEALRAGSAPPAHRRAAGARVLVAGGAGPLGAAVIEQLLASRAFVQVSVLVTRPLNAALLGLAPVLWAPAQSAPDAGAISAAGETMANGNAADETALIVFDRERHANGREQAFMRPDPAQLPALAAWLKARGVRRLLVVLPHAPAALPQALKAGLANLDEHAVAQLGFEHLLLMRPAQAGPAPRAAQPLQRVADWVLAQLQFMVPARDKPVHSTLVARFATQLAAALPAAPPGTRVLPPEIVWEAAQAADLAGFARLWLAGHATPRAPLPKVRM